MVAVPGPLASWALWESPGNCGGKQYFLFKALHIVQSPVSLGSEGLGDDV